MLVETNKLKKVSSYAKMKDTSVQSVYNWLDIGLISGVVIDGVAFVIMNSGAEEKEKSK